MNRQMLASHGVKSLRVASSLLDARGVALRLCLVGTGVTEHDLKNPDARIGLEQELVFYRNVLRLTDDSLIGLQIGSQYRLPNYGIWGYAVMSAPTLREALDLAFRFLYLTYTCHDISLQSGPDRAVLQLLALRDYEECTQVITDRDASALYCLAGEMLGRPLPLERVQFVHRGGRFRSQYEAYFKCPVSFGHDCTELHVAPAVLADTLPHSDPRTARLTEHQCEMLVTQLNRHAGVSNDIRRHLLARPGHFPSLEEVARQMGHSARSLRRQLQVEGRSYSALVNELRYQLAREYLELTPLSIHEIAQLLGYSEQSNFTHAFRQWSGVSPAKYRAGIAD